jgi:ABC-type branched-subunit amino acid transport system substrate-binding protein
MLKGMGAVGLTTLAGCASLPGGASQGRDIKLGLLMGVTGGLAALGPPIVQGAELAVKHVNDAANGFSVSTQFEDTGTDPTQGISGAQALVNAGYPMICGALSSSVTIAAAEGVCIPSGVIMCSAASTSAALTTMADNDLFFRTPPTDALQSLVLADVIKDTLGDSTASTLFLNNDYGSLLSDGFVAAFEAKGGTVQEQVSFEKQQPSYVAQLQKALAGNPDAILIIGYPESGVQILRDFYADHDSSVDILVTDGLYDPDLPGKVGNDLSNVTGTSPMPAGPGKDFFDTEFEAAFGAAPSISYCGYAYDAAAVLILANAAAGSNDGVAISKQMRKIANPGGDVVTPQNLAEGVAMAASGKDIDYQGASSAVDFDENGDLGAATYEYFKWGSSGIETISTIDYSG